VVTGITALDNDFMVAYEHNYGENTRYTVSRIQAQSSSMSEVNIWEGPTPSCLTNTAEAVCSSGQDGVYVAHYNGPMSGENLPEFRGTFYEDSGITDYYLSWMGYIDPHVNHMRVKNTFSNSLSRFNGGWEEKMSQTVGQSEMPPLFIDTNGDGENEIWIYGNDGLVYVYSQDMSTLYASTVVVNASMNAISNLVAFSFDADADGLSEYIRLATGPSNVGLFLYKYELNKAKNSISRTLLYSNSKSMPIAAYGFYDGFDNWYLGGCITGASSEFFALVLSKANLSYTFYNKTGCGLTSGGSIIVDDINYDGDPEILAKVGGNFPPGTYRFVTVDNNFLSNAS
jgi:hypothetical protein